MGLATEDRLERADEANETCEEPAPPPSYTLPDLEKAGS